MSYSNDISRLLKLDRNADRCPKCGKGPVLVDNAGGERFCGNCGFVVKEKIEETGPEWRAFSNDGKEDRRRVGTPTSITMHDMGMATVIGGVNKDASGKSISGTMKATVQRLRTWDNRGKVHESKDRNLRYALSELDRLSDKLTVSKAVIEKAAYIYRKALERGLVRGRSISAIIAASLYAACRESETPRTLKDLAVISNIKKKEIARSYRLLLKEMDIRMPVVDPAKCIARIASKAGMSERTRRRALEILTRVEKMRMSAGKDPMGLAASALYVACTLEGEDKTQRDVAEAARVTEVTIRNRYKGLRSALGI